MRQRLGLWIDRSGAGAEAHHVLAIVRGDMGPPGTFAVVLNTRGRRIRRCAMASRVPAAVVEHTLPPAARVRRPGELRERQPCGVKRTCNAGATEPLGAPRTPSLPRARVYPLTSSANRLIWERRMGGSSLWIFSPAWVDFTRLCRAWDTNAFSHQRSIPSYRICTKQTLALDRSPISDSVGRMFPRTTSCVRAFPCQPFSKAGSQLGFECPESGDLFEYILRIIDRHTPKFLVFENVPNILRHADG